MACLIDNRLHDKLINPNSQLKLSMTCSSERHRRYMYLLGVYTCTLSHLTHLKLML